MHHEHNKPRWCSAYMQYDDRNYIHVDADKDEYRVRNIYTSIGAIKIKLI